jgi:CRP-like cAMP-binding protein
MNVASRSFRDLPCRPELYEPLAQGMRELRQLFRASPVLNVAADATLIERDQPLQSLYRVRRGWACRVRGLLQGRRSIIDIYLPGDLIGFDTALLHHAPDEVVMLTHGAVQALDAGEVLRALFANPRLALSLAWTASEAQRRIERLAAALRRCDAQERIALALLDFYLRLRNRQLLSGLTYNLPLTQRQIGDYVGMTAIHVNRVLRNLRAAKIVVVESHVVLITDLARLTRLGGLEPTEAPFASETPGHVPTEWLSGQQVGLD